MVILNSLSNSSYHYFFRVDFWKFFDPCSGHGFLFVSVPWLFMLVSVHLTKEPSFLVFRDRFYEGSTDAVILAFWILSFQLALSLCCFIFIKRLFCSSSLSAIRVVSFEYLKLLVFLQAILIPACASSSPAFLMMYSAYKLNK